MTRTARVERETSETKLVVELDLDGTGTSSISTGVGFYDHMLTSLSKHSGIDLTVRADGDLHIDAHHTVEDVGIVLGTCVRRALGDARGITRYGCATIPMDEALVTCALDVSGRGAAFCDLKIPTERVGSFDTQLAKEFFIAFAANAGVTLHVRTVTGENSHHIIEASFKALARALRQAVEPDPRVSGIPTTKGSL